MGKLADRIFFACPGPTGVGFGVPFFVSGLYKFMGKLADRTFFGVQGPRGLGLGCRSLCLAFISLWSRVRIQINVYIYIYETDIYTEILFLCKADPTHA